MLATKVVEAAVAARYTSMAVAAHVRLHTTHWPVTFLAQIVVRTKTHRLHLLVFARPGIKISWDILVRPTYLNPLFWNHAVMPRPGFRGGEIKEGKLKVYQGSFCPIGTHNTISVLQV